MCGGIMHSSFVPVHITTDEFQNGAAFHSEFNALNVFRPQHAGGILKHNDHRSF